MKKPLSYDYDLFFEPENPINTEREFTDEIINYCEREKRELIILQEGMEPIVEIDSEKYVCKLGEAFRVWKIFKMPINANSYRNLGYKWVYLYKLEK